MNNRIQIREILAWMTLAIAMLLFSVTIVFAQTKTINVENEDGKVHIKISKIENGRETKIDTSFNETDDMNVDEIIESLEDRDPTTINSHKKIIKHKSGNQSLSKKHITIDLNFPEMTQADKDKLHESWEESMKEMRKGIEKSIKSLKNMYIQIDGNSDDKDEFQFHFNLPYDESAKSNDCDGYSYTYKFSHENDDESDGLKDEDHIVIIGDKDEKPPVLEKVVSSKNGKQIFIYKRVDSSKESGKKNISRDEDIKKTNKTDIRDLHYYPNPTGGKFKLTFHTDLKDDITIQVVDENGKEVFSEKISNFDGDYSKEIDLGNHSKGNYFLKIFQSGKSLTKKIVLN